MTLADRAGKTLLSISGRPGVRRAAPKCRRSTPCRRRRAATGFEVVAVNVDTGDDTKPKQFLADTGMRRSAYYRENTLALFKTLKKRGLALGLPVTLLVDRQGCLLASMNGPAEWSGPDAARLVETALGRDRNGSPYLRSPVGPIRVYL